MFSRVRVDDFDGAAGGDSDDDGKEQQNTTTPKSHVYMYVRACSHVMSSSAMLPFCTSCVQRMFVTGLRSMWHVTIYVSVVCRVSSCVVVYRVTCVMICFYGCPSALLLCVRCDVM